MNILIYTNENVRENYLKRQSILTEKEKAAIRAGVNHRCELE